MSELDDYLIHRAEQAVLGSLLAGTDPAQAGALTATGFTSPVHQAIYKAFTGRPGNWVARLRDQAARLASGRVQAAVHYLGELPGQCPEPSNLDVYAAMLREARPAHQAPSTGQPGQAPGPGPQAGYNPAQQLDGASQWLAAAAGRQGRRAARSARQPPEASGAEHLDPSTERLARAIRAAVRAGRLQRDRQPGVRRPVAAAGSAQGNEANARPSLSREDLQDAVLADLMRHPADGQALVQRVPLNVFSRGARQDLYRLIASPIAEGRPVDWLITAWQARKLQAPGQGIPAAPGDAVPESVSAIAIRLGAMRPLPGTARVIGRALLADYELSAAFGPQWTRQRELNWATAGPPAPGEQEISHEHGPVRAPLAPAPDPAAWRAPQPQASPAAARREPRQPPAAPPAPGQGHGPQPGAAQRGRGAVAWPVAPPPEPGNTGRPGPVQRG